MYLIVRTVRTSIERIINLSLNTEYNYYIRSSFFPFNSTYLTVTLNSLGGKPGRMPVR